MKQLYRRYTHVWPDGTVPEAECGEHIFSLQSRDLLGFDCIFHKKSVCAIRKLKLHFYFTLINIQCSGLFFGRVLLLLADEMA